MDQKTSELIRKIRRETALPYAEIKKALTDAAGNNARLNEILDAACTARRERIDNELKHRIERRNWQVLTREISLLLFNFIKVTGSIVKYALWIAGIVFLLIRFPPFGPDGWICKHIMPSAYTNIEQNFWNTIAGCWQRNSEDERH